MIKGKNKSEPYEKILSKLIGLAGRDKKEKLLDEWHRLRETLADLGIE